MEEQFILRVPPSVAERIERLLTENDASSSEDKSLDLSFEDDGRTGADRPPIRFTYVRRKGAFVIGNDRFPASLLDLPCVVESFKTYDDAALVKSADIGQMIMVREPGDSAPDVVEYRHGLTPPMRDARKRRFRREPDLNPELVQRVEKDLVNIMTKGTVENADPEVNEREEVGGKNARDENKKASPTPAPTPQPDAAEAEANAAAAANANANAADAERSDSDDSDDSI